MNEFKDKEYKIFDLFKNQWALVTAGDIEKYNACTVSWGSFGTLWTRENNPDGSVVTVYIHPGRYTIDFMKESDFFTVSFFPQEYRNAVGYMGSHSGRNEDKVLAAGLTPVAIDNFITFKEANTTFLCRKVYQHQFAKEDIAQDVQDYYKSKPTVYPVNGNGEWEPHWVFVGEIKGVKEKK